MKTIQIQKRRRKTMNKKEVEGIEKVIKEYLKKNLRMESRVRYLDAYSQPENYLDVYLGEEKIRTTKWLLHRLVALVYIPNPENLPYVCHKDNVPTNNSVKNLYWGTQKDNMSQASRDGRMVNKLKGKCIKGTEIQRSYIPKLIGMRFTRKEVSEITGLGHQLISDYYIKYKNKYEK